jgi:multisubunit Na+/H+ antiporter MnhB subunit
VLLLALLGAWTTAAAEDAPPRLTQTSLPLDALIRLLAPFVVLVGGYVLWAGAYTLGGAFQAAAILAAMGVLLYLSEQLQPLPAANLLWRGLLMLGAAVFCAVGLSVMATGGAFLQYPPDWAGFLILVIEASLTVSIALILVLLFSGARALSRRSR